MSERPRFVGTWTKASLGALAEIRNGGTPRTTVPEYWDGGIPWCTPTEITAAQGRILDRTARSITKMGLHSCGATLLPKGALLLCSRATIGEVRIAAMPVATNQGFKSLVCGESVDHEYLYYCLLTLKEQMVAMATGSTFLEISKRDVANVQLPLPPLAEQRAIAAVLGDVDALIESLEALITKKRAIKRAAMQQLLTGRTRLPGFSGEWETTRLGELALIATGTRNSQDKRHGGRYPFFVRSSFVERIDSFAYDCEAILVPGEGRIGGIFHYVHGRFDVHQRVYAITDFDSSVSGRFLYYYMAEYFGAHALKNTVKATVDSLRRPTFLAFQILLPPRLEQRAIAAVLADMDEEITALERRLTKTRAVKQGMMQQLLTGAIRLPIPEAVAESGPSQ